MESLDHCDSTDSTHSPASLASLSLSTAPSSIARDDGEVFRLDDPLLPQGCRNSPLAPPSHNTSKLSSSKSYSGLSGLAKASSANAITLRPSPSLSTLQQKARAVEVSGVACFGSHSRRVSNSLSDTSNVDKSNSQILSLAERRRSQTSRYLGTEDFKSAFAINLSKVKQREKLESISTPRACDSQLKGFEIMDIQSDSTSQKMNEGLEERLIKNQPVEAGMNKLGGSMHQLSETEGSLSQSSTDKLQVSSIVSELMSLPSEELTVRLEMHFRRIKLDRTEEELEARNEVISILAHQLSNQLEANDKLLHELGALRAAYASLQSSCSDYVDELEFLKTRFREGEVVEEIETSQNEAENKIRDLRQLLEESRMAISRLQVEIRNQGHRRSLQSYHLGAKNYVTSAFENETDGRWNDKPNQSSTVLVLRSEKPCEKIETSVATSLLERMALQFGSENGRVRRDSITQRLLALASLSSGADSKPLRPPKSSARSNSSSPAPVRIAHVQRSESSPAVGRVDIGTQTPDFPEVRDLENLKQRCAQLELELNESEDCRKASQVALDGLRAFISSQPSSDLSNMKLPPLPTDAENTLEPEELGDDGIGSRWNISSLLSRSNHLKSSGTAPSSPHLTSPSIKGSPALGGGFGGFSLWGRSPVLG